jgi:hypothetical protein
MALNSLFRLFLSSLAMNSSAVHIPVILTPQSGHIDPPEDLVFERTMD